MLRLQIASALGVLSEPFLPFTSKKLVVDFTMQKLTLDWN
jgi:hypothetical protein